MVLVDELLPGDVSELGLACGRPDDVGEEHGREDALELSLPQLDDEPLDRLEIRVCMLGDDIERRPGHRLVPGSGDQPCERGPFLDLLTAAAQDERRHADRAEDVADVGLVEHAECRGSVAGACGDLHVPEMPLHLLVVRHALEGKPTNADLCHRTRSPVAVEIRERPLELGLAHAPRIVRCPRDPGSRVAEDEPEGAFRMGRREHAAEWPTVGERHEHCPVASDGVQRRPEVVDTLLDRR
jgi:hypothetical protein